jgi:hypothetical protein
MLPGPERGVMEPGLITSVRPHPTPKATHTYINIVNKYFTNTIYYHLLKENLNSVTETIYRIPTHLVTYRNALH